MNLRWKLAQALEIRWWKAYLRRRGDGYLSRKAAYWQRVLAEAGIHPAPGQRVLDAGCGPAGIFMVLDGQQVDAVDPLLEHYQAKLPLFDPEAYPHVSFYTLPLEHFQPPTAYSLAFCLNAINHVADLGRSLDTLAGCLAPGGRLFLSVDVHRHPLLKHLFQWIPGDVLHPHQYGLEEYVVMLAERGLAVKTPVRLKAGRIFDYYLLEASN